MWEGIPGVLRCPVARAHRRRRIAISLRDVIYASDKLRYVSASLRNYVPGVTVSEWRRDD
jgi:hypothetical protein